jgi:hypothetical protein
VLSPRFDEGVVVRYFFLGKYPPDLILIFLCKIKFSFFSIYTLFENLRTRRKPGETTGVFPHMKPGVIRGRKEAQRRREKAYEA